MFRHSKSGGPSPEGACGRARRCGRGRRHRNSFFGDGQWGQARAQYETALSIAPTLAEAHYDLALALDRLGKQAEALAHYKQAANLAPGNRVIWNARPFRQAEAEVGKGLLDKRILHPDPQRPY